MHIWRRFVSIMLGIIGVYSLVMLAMFVFQRSLLYPAGKGILPLEYYRLDRAREVALHTPDGVALQAWYISANEDMPTLVYFQGNAGHLGDRIAKIRAYSEAGFGMLALSYRGYGTSEGSASESGMYIDARTALAYMQAEHGVPVDELLLYGESLGTGVAIQMATEHSVAAVILEAPYSSIEKRASEMYPWLPVSWLIKDKFYSIRKVATIDAPLLIFHNSGDSVVPQRHGRALFEVAKEPKQAHWMDGDGHIEFDWADITQKMKTFIVEHRL